MSKKSEKASYEGDNIGYEKISNASVRLDLRKVVEGRQKL